MEKGWSPEQLFDHLAVGISVTTWHPEDPSLTEWVFLNKARCRMTEQTADEILSQDPLGQVTRETRAQFDHINKMLVANGDFTCESTIRHRSNEVVPVTLYFKLMELDGRKCLLTEAHNITAFKEVESQLKFSRESTREMLTLIEKEKEKISENIKSNLGLVLFPLMDQLRVTATDSQKNVLDVMEDRIEKVTRELGIASKGAFPGANLTKRQTLICEMIRDGMTSKEIALALNCAPSTINNHRNIIRKKLKLSGNSANLQAYLNSSGGRSS